MFKHWQELKEKILLYFSKLMKNTLDGKYVNRTWNESL